MASRLAPTVTPDTEFFWSGLREERLLVQRCDDCGLLRHPPRPMCPRCNSLEWGTVEASGRELHLLDDRDEDGEPLCYSEAGERVLP